MTISARSMLVAAFGGALLALAVLWLSSPATVVPSIAPSPESPALSPSATEEAPLPPRVAVEPPLLPLPSLEERPAPAADLRDEIEGGAFELTNGLRSRIGVPPLARDAALDAAARRHSEDMLQRRFFAHVDPDGRGPADRVARISGLPAGAVGENIWMWSGATPPARYWLAEQAVAAWAASPAHRENIVRRGYTRLGVGAAISAGDVRLTELFRE
ncbi:MAG: CAP domain-containing protein [Vicinamibacterales bacterium]